MEESNRGFRFSGSDISEYPAYRHRFHLQYRQLRSARPELLLRWIEATIVGQARRYIRNAFSIFDSGRKQTFMQFLSREIAYPVT